MKKLTLILSVLFCVAAWAGQKGSSVIMLSAATATGASHVMQPNGSKRTFFCHGTTSAGAGASAISVYVTDVLTAGACPSAAATHYKVIGTITLTLGTTRTNDGFASDAPWPCVYMNVDSISGTDGTVSCYMGVE